MFQVKLDMGKNLNETYSEGKPEVKNKPEEESLVDVKLLPKQGLCFWRK